MKNHYHIPEEDLPEVREDLAVTTASLNTYNTFRSTKRTMPCCFSDEEWKEEIRLSEESGIASDEEISIFYKKWGIAL